MSRFSMLSVLAFVAACSNSGGDERDAALPIPDDAVLPIPDEADRVDGGILECGSLEVARAASGTLERNSLNVGELVSGVLGPGAGIADFWVAPVQAGRYRVVLDSARTDGERGNAGLDLRASVGGVSLGNLFETDRVDRRVRETAVLTVTAPRGQPVDLSLAVTGELIGEGIPQRYELALLGAESAVPVPYFIECPTVTPLALDTVEAFSIGPGDVERWLSLGHPTGDYEISFGARRRSGLVGNIDFEFQLYGSYAMNQSGADFFRSRGAAAIDNQFELTVSGPTDPSVVRSDGTIYVRFRNLGETLDMEVSLSPDDPSP